MNREEILPKRRCGEYGAVKPYLARRQHEGRRVRSYRRSWPVRFPILFAACAVLLVCSVCVVVTPEADSTPPPERHDQPGVKKYLAEPSELARHP